MAVPRRKIRNIGVRDIDDVIAFINRELIPFLVQRQDDATVLPVGVDVRRYGTVADVTNASSTIIAGTNSFTLSGLSSTDIGKAIVFHGCGAADANGHAVPMAGTIINVDGTTVYTSFFAVQTSHSVLAYGTDDTAAIQAAYDALSSGEVLYFPHGTYGITRTWGGTKACRIVGEGRGSTVLQWLSGPGAATNLIRLYGGGIYESSVEHLQFLAPPYTTLDFCHIEDCAYLELHDLTFGVIGFNTAGNQTTGIHLKNLRTGQVPPRQDIVIRNILVTHEVNDRNGDGSHGIWIEGNAAEGFQQVTVEGEANIEQSEWGIRLDYCSNSIIKTTGLIQGNRHNIAIYNSDHAKVDFEVTCANAKRAVTLTNLRDLFVDVTCSNFQGGDPAGNPARVEVNDPSYLWLGTETRLTNLPSPTFRGTTTVTGVNASRYGQPNYTSVRVMENTVNDGYYSVRTSMKHADVQSDVFEEFFDSSGNRQMHFHPTAQLRGYYSESSPGVADFGSDATPGWNMTVSGVQSSRKTTLGGVFARARFDGRADVDEIAVIAQRGSAQTKNVFEAQDAAEAGIMGFNENCLLKWIDSHQTQTTVGAAGGSSAAPATPQRWLKVVDADGTILVLPGYLAS